MKLEGDYKQFVDRLLRALGYEEESITNPNDLATLCNHAAVRIERLETELEHLRNER